VTTGLQILAPKGEEEEEEEERGLIKDLKRHGRLAVAWREIEFNQRFLPLSLDAHGVQRHQLHQTIKKNSSSSWHCHEPIRANKRYGNGFGRAS